ncbi:MAG TPA: DUF6691 family protein, partial [Gemmatimonadaceae bacterium]|nr:DUF6691 family protein [Gemmatimonadaceae bacterium]
GMVGVYLLSAMGVPMKFDVKPTYVLGVALGGLIFGVGFALSGYCPGTCVVGAGEGRRDALSAVGGGVVGALLFTLVYRWIEPVLVKPMSYGKITLADLFHTSTLVMAIAVAAIMWAIVLVLPTVRKPAAAGGATKSA